MFFFCEWLIALTVSMSFRLILFGVLVGIVSLTRRLSRLMADETSHSSRRRDSVPPRRRWLCTQLVDLQRYLTAVVVVTNFADWQRLFWTAKLALIAKGVTVAHWYHTGAQLWPHYALGGACSNPWLRCFSRLSPSYSTLLGLRSEPCALCLSPGCLSWLLSLAILDVISDSDSD